MTIWQVSREYAGLAEAGGVKNVVCSLSEGLSRLGNNVTLFIPQYGCSDFSNVFDFEKIPNSSFDIEVNSKKYLVSFAKGKINDVEIIFLVSDCFLEKKGVYTYTKEEEEENPDFIRGHGHKDSLEIEMIFQKSLIKFLKSFSIKPDIIHCHDATTAFIPVLANTSENKEYFNNTNFVVTIHNAGPAYHHEINGINKAKDFTGLPKDMLKLGLLNDSVEPYLLSAFYGKLTTVSPWYGNEILDPNNNNTQGLSEAFFKNKIKIYGITNGIDFENYNPTDINKSHLPYPYNPEKLSLEGKYQCRNGFFNYFGSPILNNSEKAREMRSEGLEQFGYLEKMHNDTVIFAYHGRLVYQKGLDVLSEAMPLCLQNNSNIRFIITGQGDKRLEENQINLAKQFPGKVLYLRGYNKTLARLCVAVSDFIVLPSFFEPCGLEDFIASILGTIPIAHKTGGLQKIQNNITGFLYENNDAKNLSTKLLNLLDFKNQYTEKFFSMIEKAAKEVHYSYDWANVIKKYYIPLYLNKN